MVLFTFCREDELDRAVKRLVASLPRLLEPWNAPAASAADRLFFDTTSTVMAGGRSSKVRIAENERFVVCFNAALRELTVAPLTEMIDGSSARSDLKRGELRGRISTMPGLNRYLRHPAASSSRCASFTHRTTDRLRTSRSTRSAAFSARNRANSARSART